MTVTPEALVGDYRQATRVAEQAASLQSAGLLGEGAEPFQAGSLYPRPRASRKPG